MRTTAIFDTGLHGVFEFVDPNSKYIKMRVDYKGVDILLTLLFESMRQGVSIKSNPTKWGCIKHNPLLKICPYKEPYFSFPKKSI